MKKLWILIVALAFTACNNGLKVGIKASGGSFTAEQEQEDFQEMLKQRNSYNSLYRSVVSDIADAWDSMLDIFGDYVVADQFADELLSADSNSQFGFGGYNDNDNELYY